MSMMVSILLSFSPGKSLEGNTVRTTKGTYSQSLCWRSQLGQSVPVQRGAYRAPALGFFVPAPLFIAFLRPVRKEKKKNRIVIYNRICY